MSGVRSWVIYNEPTAPNTIIGEYCCGVRVIAKNDLQPLMDQLKADLKGMRDPRASAWELLKAWEGENALEKPKDLADKKP